MTANYLPFWSLMIISQVWLATGHRTLGLVWFVAAVACLMLHEWLFARGKRKLHDLDDVIRDLDIDMSNDDE